MFTKSKLPTRRNSRNSREFHEFSIQNSRRSSGIHVVCQVGDASENANNFITIFLTSVFLSEYHTLTKKIAHLHNKNVICPLQGINLLSVTTVYSICYSEVLYNIHEICELVDSRSTDKSLTKHLSIIIMLFYINLARYYRPQARYCCSVPWCKMHIIGMT